MTWVGYFFLRDVLTFRRVKFNVYATNILFCATEFCFCATILRDESLRDGKYQRRAKVRCRQVFARRKNGFARRIIWFFATGVCATNKYVRRAKSFFFILEFCHCRGRMQKQSILPLPLSQPLCCCWDFNTLIG